MTLLRSSQILKSFIMKNFPINHEGKTYWIARNVAVACFVFAKINNTWCVLANQRGFGSADFQGMWNAPCGYLDYGETTAQAAIREVYEETGVKLSSVDFWEVQDDPTAHLQNVTFRYYSIIENPTQEMLDLSIEDRGGEQNEVGAIAWIPLDQLNEFKWAFNHGEIINQAAYELGVV